MYNYSIPPFDGFDDFKSEFGDFNILGGYEKRRHPMTLIAAVMYKDCVLIGSDSKAEGDCGTYNQEKLCKFLDTQLVWGGSGDARIIDDLNSWISSHKNFNDLNSLPNLENSSLNIWLEKLSRELANQNGRNIGRCNSFKLNEDVSIITAELLIAGYLKNKQLLVTINRKGIISYDTRQGFTASGSERDRFIGALQALISDRDIYGMQLKDVIKSFGKALDASIKDSAKVDFPVQMWIAQKDNVKQILGLDNTGMPTLDRLEAYFDKEGN